MQRPKMKRTRRFVDRSVQGALLLAVTAHWALFLTATAVLLVIIDMAEGVLFSVPERSSFTAAVMPIALVVLVLTPMFVYDMVRMSHRFAGPLVRLRRAMHDLADGREVPPVHFREGDFWHELAADFNRVSARVRSAGGMASAPPEPGERPEDEAASTAPAEGAGANRDLCGSSLR